MACDPSSSTTRLKGAPPSCSCAAPTQLETTTGATRVMSWRTSSRSPRTCADAAARRRGVSDALRALARIAIT